MSFHTYRPWAEHLERQARHVRLLGYGQPGVHRANAAHVVVVGAGGLGCPALQVLAASGIGILTLIDDDEVERSNLARQTLYREGDIGRPKVVAAVDALKGLGPETTFQPCQVRLERENAAELFAGADLVVDTTDHWPTRFAVADACRAARIPLVWGSVLGWDALLTVFLPGPENPTLDDLVDREQQLTVEGPNCATAGVFAPLVAELGSAMAGEALRIVTGAGSPLAGTVRVTNGRTGRVREIPLAAADPTDTSSTTTAEPRSTNPAPSIRPDELIVDVRPAAHPDLELAHRYLHLPLETIAQRVAQGEIDDLPLDEPLVVACAQGPRARYASELLTEAGARAVRTLPGGIPALSALVDLETRN
ncbi:HesA/MoeB/ThiF family protein [Gulosibacter molinativorax]|uniref:Rhodanese domain-containing protein n=1 Tax=Gulosibacter molinativorax TaxID=256821 RepID=A0ABT7CAW5_9MICO|nr:HesA/MoeB/ThiF family protein [Gulosibacter molinativorax]MDJ1372351.1 hypothetical protein [Gulosibacter molinativorax]QUY63559.1 Putative adenylyltransferase/sulfurtransferase MoeZ [Gulosibacter molinativorax]